MIHWAVLLEILYKLIINTHVRTIVLLVLGTVDTNDTLGCAVGNTL